MPCSVGCDLSQGDDFCAFTFLFPIKTGEFGVKTKSYISSRTLDRLPVAMRNKYDEFIQDGSLIVMDGSILNMLEVYDDLMRHINSRQYAVLALGYDPYNAEKFIEKFGRKVQASTEKVQETRASILKGIESVGIKLE